VLFGAFDRYNYGDNLMPVLFEMFIEKYGKHLLNEFEFEYAAISSSDLDRYACYKTKSVNSILNTIPAGSAFVVIGGEVLCGRNQSLFLHMQDNLLHHTVLKIFRKLLPSVFNAYAKNRYSTPWEFPFIPSVKFFKEDVKIIFNTVGGDLTSLNKNELIDVKKRIFSSDYFSVRDNRTFDHMKVISKETILVPDSAYIMSDLIGKPSLMRKVNSIFLDKLPDDYFVFQAAPNKVGCSATDCIKYISALADKTGKKVLLLPIGYASGHDDLYLLRKVHKALAKKTVLLYELTIWEIMYAIVASKGYFGTSLHGAITAMSFNTPHFGINKKIAKLDAFLQDWSVPPFNRCYPIEELASLPELISEQANRELKAKSAVNIELVKDNYLNIIKVINVG